MGDEVVPPNHSHPSERSHFKAIFDHAPLGMDLTDNRGRFLRVNPALCRMLGYSESELLEMRWQELTHPDDLLESEQRLERAFGGSDVVEFTKRYVHRSGRILWCKLNSSLVRDENGTPLYAVGQTQDVTRQRALEHQLRQSQKMETVGRLAGGVAHDFNNLLLVINNYAQMLRDDMEANDPRGSDLDEIIEAGARGTRLVQQLLAFARREVVRPQVISLNEVIEAFVEMLPRTIGENIEVTVELEPELDKIRIDLSQIEQIILNLAVNAGAAMTRGGTLHFRTANAVEEGTESAGLEPGNYVRLEVIDNGEGIDPEILPKLFDPFFTTKPRGEGAGLGLATVYGIVDAAGGAVEVSSEPGAGTTIRVMLPAATEGESST